LLKFEDDSVNFYVEFNELTKEVNIEESKEVDFKILSEKVLTLIASLENRDPDPFLLLIVHDSRKISDKH